MNQFSKSVVLLSAFAAPGLVFLSGCSKPSVKEEGPSYAELVTIYNAELQTLDRLQRKRDELIAKRDAAIGPPTKDATETIEALLSSANEAAQQMNLDDVTDPNDLLARAAEHAEKAHDLTSEILESVSSAAEPTEEELVKQTELIEQFDGDLAAIESEITEQEARVDRARSARDAAEAVGE